MLKFGLLTVMALCVIAGPSDPMGHPSDDDSLKDVKCCLMTKNNVKESFSVDYRDGKVYFCCNRCKGAFDPEKHAVKGNQQLVETGQYTQTSCPFSGEDVDESQSVKVGKADVHFCCGNCVAKVKGAKDDAARAEMLFNNETFEKTFAKADDEDSDEDGDDDEDDDDEDEDGDEDDDDDGTDLK
jgi:hypothetical protein